MEVIEGRKQYCGEVFVTSYGVMMLECKFCANQFGVYEEFFNHIFDYHFDNITECKYNINEDDPLKSVDGDIVELDPMTVRLANQSDTTVYPVEDGSKSPGISGVILRLEEEQLESIEELAEMSTINAMESANMKQLKTEYKKKSKSSIKQKNPNHQPNIPPVQSTSNTVENHNVKQIKADDEKQSEQPPCYEQQQMSNPETKIQTNIRPVKRKPDRKSDMERKFKCKFCDLDLFTRKNLKTHVERHLNNRRYTCTTCSKAFFSQTELTIHTRFHTGERPFICPYCGKGFITLAVLNQHEQRHLNKRTFKCDQCDKSYFNGTNLRQHIAATHAGERNFICKECNKAFTRKKVLRNHMKLHENALSYECNICHMRFNQKPTLLWHKRRRHELVSGENTEKTNNVVLIKQTNERSDTYDLEMRK